MYGLLVRMLNRLLSNIKLVLYKFVYGPKFNVKSIVSCNMKGRLQIHLFDQGKLTIGSNVISVGPLYILCSGTGKIEISNHVFFNHNVSVTTKSRIAIGSHCMFGNNVVIVDHDHDMSEVGNSEFSVDEVIIEDNCWIGANTTITKGVRIGTGSVIAANSVVTKNVEPHCLYAGVPARRIRSL